ncbi:MAG: chromosomal replication initiator protein DnaA [Micrococcales bacterium]
MAESDAVEGLWQSLLTRLSNDNRITRQMLGFLSLVEPVATLGETLYVEVPHELARAMIEQRISSIITELMADNAEWGGATRISIAVNPALDPDLDSDSTPEPSPVAIEPVPSYLANPVAPASASVSDSRLNPKYTFDTFVTGESNRFAHAAAFAVAEDPAKAYNPLFIYGSSGLGKTHLLHAIGHYAISLNQRLKVRYVSSEEFTNAFINAIQTNRTVEFQAEYRGIDILLIDDIQFLQGKDQTQEAFFHIFNNLHDHNKQVVITSDQPPKLMSGFEERMITRFEWGLMTDIQAPELETRIAILRKKSETLRLRVGEEILEYIAARVSSSIRELEGTLIRVTAFANLNKRPVDMALVQTILKDSVVVGDNGGLTPVQIMNTVAKYYGLSVDDLSGSSRFQAIVRARQVAMYLCRDQTDLSLPKIGQLFGNRDHTTVMYACNKITSELKERRELWIQVTEILNRLKNNPKA